MNKSYIRIILLQYKYTCFIIVSVELEYVRQSGDYWRV